MAWVPAFVRGHPHLRDELQILQGVMERKLMRLPSLMSALQECMHDVPQKPVALWGKEAPSFAEAYSLASVLARYFLSIADIKPGDVVLLSSPNSMGQFCVVCAAQACGADVLIAPIHTNHDAFVQAITTHVPKIALVADADSCAWAKENVPDCKVFSMGSPEVDAPSIGYMADQAIGLVDEVFLKVEDYAFDAQRSTKCYFIDQNQPGKITEWDSASLVQKAEGLVGDLQLSSNDTIFAAISFSIPAGLIGVYAAFFAQASLVLTGGGSAELLIQQQNQFSANVIFAGQSMLTRLADYAESSGELMQGVRAMAVESESEPIAGKYARACSMEHLAFMEK